MSELNLTTPLTTCARVLLCDWAFISQLLEQYSLTRKAMKEKEREGESTLQMTAPIISNDTYQESVQGPFGQFFRPLLKAYSKLLPIRLALHIAQEDVLKEARDLHFAEKALNNPLAEKLNLDYLVRLQEDLNQLAQTLHTLWQDHLKEGISHLIKTLGEEKLSLSILEISEFYEYEPLCELQERYQIAHLELPKIEVKNLGFTDYLKLKTVLTIQSALSRQQQPHQNKDIQAVFKPLKKTFEMIQKQEHQLIKEQEEKIQAILKALS